MSGSNGMDDGELEPEVEGLHVTPKHLKTPLVREEIIVRLFTAVAIIDREGKISANVAVARIGILDIYFTLHNARSEEVARIKALPARDRKDLMDQRKPMLGDIMTISPQEIRDLIPNICVTYVGFICSVMKIEPKDAIQAMEHGTYEVAYYERYKCTTVLASNDRPTNYHSGKEEEYGVIMATVRHFITRGTPSERWDEYTTSFLEDAQDDADAAAQAEEGGAVEQESGGGHEEKEEPKETPQTEAIQGGAPEDQGDSESEEEQAPEPEPEPESEDEEEAEPEPVRSDHHHHIQIYDIPPHVTVHNFESLHEAMMLCGSQCGTFVEHIAGSPSGDYRINSGDVVTKKRVAIAKKCLTYQCEALLSKYCADIVARHRDFAVAFKTFWRLVAIETYVAYCSTIGHHHVARWSRSKATEALHYLAQSMITTLLMEAAWRKNIHGDGSEAIRGLSKRFQDVVVAARAVINMPRGDFDGIRDLMGGKGQLLGMEWEKFVGPRHRGLIEAISEAEEEAINGIEGVFQNFPNKRNYFLSVSGASRQRPSSKDQAIIAHLPVEHYGEGNLWAFVEKVKAKVCGYNEPTPAIPSHSYYTEASLAEFAKVLQEYVDDIHDLWEHYADYSTSHSGGASAAYQAAVLKLVVGNRRIGGDLVGVSPESLLAARHALSSTSDSVPASDDKDKTETQDDSLLGALMRAFQSRRSSIERPEEDDDDDGEGIPSEWGEDEDENEEGDVQDARDQTGPREVAEVQPRETAFQRVMEMFGEPAPPEIPQPPLEVVQEEILDEEDKQDDDQPVTMTLIPAPPPPPPMQRQKKHKPAIHKETETKAEQEATGIPSEIPVPPVVVDEDVVHPVTDDDEGAPVQPARPVHQERNTMTAKEFGTISRWMVLVDSLRNSIRVLRNEGMYVPRNIDAETGELESFEDYYIRARAGSSETREELAARQKPLFTTDMSPADSYKIMVHNEKILISLLSEGIRRDMDWVGAWETKIRPTLSEAKVIEFNKFLQWLERVVKHEGSRRRRHRGASSSIGGGAMKKFSQASSTFHTTLCDMLTHVRDIGSRKPTVVNVAPQKPQEVPTLASVGGAEAVVAPHVVATQSTALDATTTNIRCVAMDRDGDGIADFFVTIGGQSYKTPSSIKGIDLEAEKMLVTGRDQAPTGRASMGRVTQPSAAKSAPSNTSQAKSTSKFDRLLKRHYGGSLVKLVQDNEDHSHAPLIVCRVHDKSLAFSGAMENKESQKRFLAAHVFRFDTKSDTPWISRPLVRSSGREQQITIPSSVEKGPDIRWLPGVSVYDIERPVEGWDVAR